MTGSFSSINTALTALRYNQVSMDVASNNIANVGTEGYHRRRVIGESVAAPSTPALWSRYDGFGGGVRITGVDRFADPLLDARSRTEHASSSFLDARTVALSRLENGIGEPGDNGVSAAMAQFRSAWADLSDNPDSTAARTVVLSSSRGLADAFAAQARNVGTEQATQRGQLLTVVDEVNTVAAELAATNRTISAAGMDQLDTSDLADQRDRLALRLADLAGGVATRRTDGGMDVAVGGVSIVDGIDAARLSIASGVTAAGEADGSPVTFAMTAAGVTTPVAGALRGQAGASTELLNLTLPAYASSLGAVVSSLADGVNAAHVAGYDLAGATGGALFAYDPADPAGSLSVALSDGAAIAASSLPGGARDGSVADALATSGADEASYQRLVTGFGVDVASSRRLAATQALLTTQIDSSREQLTGVNLDEEMISMLSAQRAYEAASRVMTVVDSVLDTLINRTGLTR